MKIEREEIVVRYKEKNKVQKIEFATYAQLGKWTEKNYKYIEIINIINNKTY